VEQVEERLVRLTEIMEELLENEPHPNSKHAKVRNVRDDHLSGFSASLRDLQHEFPDTRAVQDDDDISIKSEEDDDASVYSPLYDDASVKSEDNDDPFWIGSFLSENQQGEKRAQIDAMPHPAKRAKSASDFW